MKSFLPSLILLCCSFFSLPVLAEQNTAKKFYEEAKKSYTILLEKENPKRHHFEKVIGAFRRVIKKYPSSQESPKALYNIAGLYRKIYKISRWQKDKKIAKEVFLSLADAYASSSLADDALLFAAELSHDQEEAIALLEELLERYPDGDQKEEAKKRLKTLSP